MPIQTSIAIDATAAELEIGQQFGLTAEILATSFDSIATTMALSVAGGGEGMEVDVAYAIGYGADALSDGVGTATIILDEYGSGTTLLYTPAQVPVSMEPEELFYNITPTAMRDGEGNPYEMTLVFTIGGDAFLYNPAPYAQAINNNNAVDRFIVNISGQDVEVEAGYAIFYSGQRRANSPSDYAQVQYSLNIQNGPALGRLTGFVLPVVYRDGSWAQIAGSENVGVLGAEVDVQLDATGAVSATRSYTHDVLRLGLGIQEDEDLALRFNGTITDATGNAWQGQFVYSMFGYVYSLVSYEYPTYPNVAVPQGLVDELQGLFTSLVTDFSNNNTNDRSIRIHTIQEAIGTNGERTRILSPNFQLTSGLLKPLSQSAASRALGRPTAEKVFEFTLPFSAVSDLTNSIFVTTDGAQWVAIPGENNLGQSYRVYTKFLAKNRT
jgi:hypothetical protein